MKLKYREGWETVNIKTKVKRISKAALAAAALNFYDRVSDAISDLEVDLINELFNRRIDFALCDPLDREDLQANCDNIRAIEEKIEALGVTTRKCSCSWRNSRSGPEWQSR